MERGLPLTLWDLDLGADRYLRDGTTFPAEIRRAIQEECSAVLLGAVGDPRVPGMQHAHDIVFGLRQGFDLYANVRPVKALADRLVPLKGKRAADVDFVVFRENTEGAYVSIGGQFKRGTPDEIALNEELNTRKGVERIIRAAFAYALAEGRPRVHMADKANAIRHAHDLWTRVFDEVRQEYPTIESEHLYIDTLCLRLVQDPESFSVIVTNNLFGDIVTDLGAALQGGLGMAASASVHSTDQTRVAVFEPVHGSAPPLVGKDRANPFACFLSVAMLLEHLGFSADAVLIETVVRRAIHNYKCTHDVGGALGMRATSAWVCDEIRRLLPQGPKTFSNLPSVLAPCR